MKRETAKLEMDSWKEQRWVGPRNGERRGINNTKDTWINYIYLQSLHNINITLLVYEYVYVRVSVCGCVHMCAGSMTHGVFIFPQRTIGYLAKLPELVMRNIPLNISMSRDIENNSGYLPCLGGKILLLTMHTLLTLFFKELIWYWSGSVPCEAQCTECCYVAAKRGK